MRDGAQYTVRARVYAETFNQPVDLSAPLELQVSEIEERAREIAKFFNLPIQSAFHRLSLGFGHQHQLVAEDWRRANPQTDREILDWYRTTDAYVWELTAYHLDLGFAYERTCQSIAERLTSENAIRVLCLGDGIGDLTLYLWRQGFEAVYHDLRDSVTERFAGFRFSEQTGQPQPCSLSETWDAREIIPPQDKRYHAIVSLDFLEHVTDVPRWVEVIHESLAPKGILVAQNAFGMGSGEGGSMPMHLQRNDRYEKEWDTLLSEVGFYQMSPQWYRKK